MRHCDDDADADDDDDKYDCDHRWSTSMRTYGYDCCFPIDRTGALLDDAMRASLQSVIYRNPGSNNKYQSSIPLTWETGYTCRGFSQNVNFFFEDYGEIMEAKYVKYEGKQAHSTSDEEGTIKNRRRCQAKQQQQQ